MPVITIPQLTPRKIGTAHSLKVVARSLGNYAYAEQRLLEAQAGWLASIPLYELKIELGVQLYEDACHVDALRRRLPELGVFEGGVEPPNGDFVRFCSELTNTEDLLERLVGVFWLLRPALVEAYLEHMAKSDTVADAPTVRVLDAAQRDHSRFAIWGDKLIWSLMTNSADHEHAKQWRDHLNMLLQNAGGVTGKAIKTRQSEVICDDSPGKRFRMDLPQRDERFYVAPYIRREGRAATDVWDQESFLKYMFMMVEGEIEVTEACGRTLFDFPDAPWELRFLIARQLWDEARHAELSLQRFFELGGKLNMLPVRDTFPLYFGSVRHQDLGRRLMHLNQVVEGWVTDDFAMIVDICRALDDERSACLFEQLIADEWLHIKIGADWIPKLTANDKAYRLTLIEYRMEAERELYTGLDVAARETADQFGKSRGTR